MFTTRLQVEKRLSSKKWVLTAPLVWDGKRRVVVPDGFETDLTTRWFEGKHTEASVVHDYCLKRFFGWPESNEIMLDCMVFLNVHPLRRKYIFAAVTVNGWYHNYIKGPITRFIALWQ